MHGQNGEDDILLAHFGDKSDGRFLDVGAWAAPTFSNTYAFAERGWSGVCVEPSPRPFLNLLDTYAKLPGVKLVNVAVAEKCGLADFHASDDAISTLSEQHREAWASRAKFYPTFTINTVTVGRLLDRYGFDFDLLSIDVEGGSAALLKEFPLAGMPKLRAIVCEHDGRADWLAAWARAFGFTEHSRNNENIILLR